VLTNIVFMPDYVMGTHDIRMLEAKAHNEGPRVTAKVTYRSSTSAEPQNSLNN
jgi:hypothetical protein